MRKPSNSLSIKKALDLLRLPGHKLMLMHSRNQPNGKSYFVVPGGYVEPKVAQKIIERPDVRILDEGLLTDHPQSWALHLGVE